MGVYGVQPKLAFMWDGELRDMGAEYVDISNSSFCKLLGHRRANKSLLICSYFHG